MTFETELTGCTEGAGHCTPCLAADAQGCATWVPHQDRLYGGSIWSSEQPLAGAAAIGRLFDLDRKGPVGWSETIPDLGREIGHVARFEHRVFVEPLSHLIGAVAGFISKQVTQLLGSDEVGQGSVSSQVCGLSNPVGGLLIGDPGRCRHLGRGCRAERRERRYA